MIPFVTITLDKPYNMRFGMGAQVEFEQISGITISEFAEELQKGASMEHLSIALFVMIRKEAKSLAREFTLNDVYDLVDDHSDGLNDVIEAVSKAITAAYEVKQNPNAKPPKK